MQEKKKMDRNKCYYNKCCITRLNSHSNYRNHELYPCINKCTSLNRHYPPDETIVTIEELRKAINKCIEIDALHLDQPFSSPFDELTEETREKRKKYELKDKWRNYLQNIIDLLELKYE